MGERIAAFVCAVGDCGGMIMAAYIIAETETLDPELISKYRTLAPPAVAKYGGRYLVLGAAIETLEGAASPRRLAVIEFPDMEAARQWYGSAEYAEALAISKEAMRRRLTLVQGVAG
jgi:uncharacterized protein (DUF1330 family)